MIKDTCSVVLHSGDLACFTIDYIVCSLILGTLTLLAFWGRGTRSANHSKIIAWCALASFTAMPALLALFHIYDIALIRWGQGIGDWGKNVNTPYAKYYPWINAFVIISIFISTALIIRFSYCILKIANVEKTLITINSSLLEKTAEKHPFIHSLTPYLKGIIVSDQAHSAFVFGFNYSHLVIPKDSYESMKEDELAIILAHEAAHIGKRDLWLGILSNFSNALYWWNPLVWFTVKQASIASEQAADQQVVNQHLSAKEYAQWLVDKAKSHTPACKLRYTMGLMNTRSELKLRIQYLKKISSHLPHTPGKLEVLFTILCSTAALFLAISIRVAESYLTIGT